MTSFFPFFRLKTLLVASAMALSLQPLAHATEAPAEVHLDYAYYSPVSLVLKHFGFLEKALPQTKVSWVLSQGSNRSLEYLNSGGVDFASSASLAAVLSRANGSPIKSVYVYSRAEWTALVVRKDSPYQSVADLKGKKIAATKGTDPYLFTLRSLQQAGLKKTTWNWCTCNIRTGAPRWKRRRRRLGRTRSAHGRQSGAGRFASAIPQPGVQQLWRGQRHRAVRQGASAHHRHGDQSLRAGARMGAENPEEFAALLAKSPACRWTWPNCSCRAPT